MKIKTSITIDEKVLENAAMVMSYEDRPSLSNTIEFMMKKGYEKWVEENSAKSKKKVK